MATRLEKTITAMLRPGDEEFYSLLEKSGGPQDMRPAMFAQRKQFGLMLRREIPELLASNDWPTLFGWARSQDRLPWLRHLWPHIRPEGREGAFLSAYGSSDAPSLEYAFVVRALRWFGSKGIVPADEQGVSALASLPALIRVFRGTVGAEVESGRVGVSWTIDRAKAAWFATKHGRFRNASSPAVILSLTVPREAVRAAFFEREEGELLLDGPAWKCDIRCEPIEDLDDEGGMA
jgi:hypothetical protein